MYCPFCLTGFNPRTHAGCDVKCLRWCKMVLVFQSTHPRGVRPIDAIIHKTMDVVSIHAPTRGATSIVELPKIVDEVSIHAPTRGATQHIVYLYCLHQVSIHAPTRGATDDRKRYDLSERVSIHAPTRGATVKLIFRL